MVLGNLAPRLSFNRYTGLRLPWTVRDEDAWIVAHRILGCISLPFGILYFFGAWVQIPFDKWVKIWFLGVLFAWFGIPALLSAVYYYKNGM